MITLVFDCETTGLTLHPRADLSKQPRMIEFGAVLMNGRGKIIEEASILINPEQPLEFIIMKITGLKDSDLKTEPTFKKMEPTFRRLFASADRMIAHNLPFDMSIVKGELDRAKVTDWKWPESRICTVQAYREEWGRNPRLVELYERVMGCPLKQTHRALDDALALADIVKKVGLYK